MWPSQPTAGALAPFERARVIEVGPCLLVIDMKYAGGDGRRCSWPSGLRFGFQLALVIVNDSQWLEGALAGSG